MFKFVVTSLFFVTVIVESLKYTLRCCTIKLVDHQKYFYFSEVCTAYLIPILFFFTKLVLLQQVHVTLLFFFLASLLFLNQYVTSIYKNHYGILLTLSLFTWGSLATFNIASFIIVSELLSITTFFILFFSNGFFRTNLNLGVFYFLVSNIITFLFGVVLIIIFMCFYGSLNILNLSFFLCHSSSIYINIFIAVYFLLKLGQGPSVFFKFRFYRSTHIFNLILYLFVYVILIWPFLFYILVELSCYLPAVSTIILLVTSVYLVQSVFFFTGVMDFIVFSTWAFIWYQTVYTLI